MIKTVDYGLEDKVAIVTGGASGIGQAISKKLHAIGMKVAVFDINVTKSANMGMHEGDRLTFIACDVSSSRQVEGAVERVISKWGTVDVLVNNAGTTRYGDVVDQSEKDWDMIIGTNLKGSFLVSKYVIPHMLKNGKGVVINMGSVQSLIPTKRAAAYVASKGGILMLTKSIALDFAPAVRSIAILPGTIHTPLVEWAAELEIGTDKGAVADKIAEWGKAHLLGRVGAPEEVANLVAFASSDLASFITGTYLLIDGGLSNQVSISTPSGRD